MQRLRCGPVHVVLAVDGLGDFCVTRRYFVIFDQQTEDPLQKLDWAKPLLEDVADCADVERRLGTRNPRT